MYDKEYGQVVGCYYEDYDEYGLIHEGFTIESEFKGTLIKVERKNETNK